MTQEEYIQEVTVHKAMMYRIAFTILQNDSDVQDALQEAALKAWQKQKTLRNENLFASWMTRIVINESYQIRRKQKRMIYLDELPETPVSSDGVSLKMLMETLPNKLRLPFVMHYAEGMDAQEIAYALKITPSAVNSRSHPAKTMPRKDRENDERTLL